MSDDNAALILVSDANEPRTVQLAYYVCRVEDRYFQPGQYVRVTRVEPNGIVHFQHRDRGYTAPIDSFLDQFEYAPEGEARLQAEIAAVMDDINRESREVADHHQALTQATPYLAAGGQDAAGLESLAALVPVEDRSLVGVKRSLARVQGLIHDKQASLQVRQKELQALMAEQLAVVNALIRPMEEVSNRRLKRGGLGWFATSSPY